MRDTELCRPYIHVSPQGSFVCALFLVLQAKRHSSAAAETIAAQVGMLSAGQPPVEAAPTPQGYAQRQALNQGQNQTQNQAQAMMEAAGGQDNGQAQSLIDQSRPRNADMDGVVEDGGGAGGLSDQQKQPINLSQVRFVFKRARVQWLVVRIFLARLLSVFLLLVCDILSNARKAPVQLESSKALMLQCHDSHKTDH